MCCICWTIRLRREFLQAGDEIVGVEGQSIESLGYTDAVTAIKGEAGYGSAADGSSER